jgi:hypothetical protein
MAWRRDRLGAWALIGGAWSVASLPACVDLFHSTDFGGACPPDAATCRDAAPGDAKRGRDAQEDRSTGKPTDATVDHRGTTPADAGRDARDTGRDAQDARADATLDSAAPADAGHDAGHDTGPVTDAPKPSDARARSDARDASDDRGVRDAKPAGDATTPVDAGTNFCAWSAETAQASAEHACLWLGACAGTASLNAYGTCYPNALMAYDCTLNPNQQVRGELHAFWDALWQARSCDDVLHAIFPGGPPSCPSGATVCGDALTGADASSSVAVACGGGGFASAVNCQMAGHTCASGACTNGGPSCDAAVTPTPSCSGSVFHKCQAIENNPEAGTTYVVVDVGKDCAYFGAGSCVVDTAAGIGGCEPNDASTSCTLGLYATCAPGDPTWVAGCATGHLETLRCPRFGVSAGCSIDGGWFASSDDLVQGCYNPAHNGYSTHSYCGPTYFETYAGPAGIVQPDCLDAGLTGGCTVTSNGPYCSAP